MQLKITLDEQKIIDGVTGDSLGMFVSREWKRLINPYTPRDTQTMENTAKLLPFKIHYIQVYSNRVYNGKDFHFQKINPYSTYEWDLKAAQAGQLDKLYRTINDALRSGRF